MSSPRILVVDDEPDIRNLVREILEDEGYEVQVADSAAAAREARLRRRPDLILLDIWMPDVDGVTLLKEWTEEGGPSCPVVMMSGHGTVETAVEATRLGAYDFIEKPLSLAKLLLTVERALAAGAPLRERGTARPPLRDAIEPVGRSAVMRELREQARKLARHDSWLLISGETGSGKHCLARYIHAQSARRAGPLVEFNAESVEAERAERTLFGSEDASGIVRGRLEEAAGGTLLLTAVSALEPTLQARLVALLDSGRYYRVGGSVPLEFDARIIATNRRPLESEVAAGRLREDLYYHLNVVPLRVPPLREHIEDVPELLAFWVDRLVEREKLPYRRFALAAQNRLRNYDWPGNIRELKNLVQRLLIMGRGEEIGLEETEAALAANAVPAAADEEEIAMPLDLPLRDAREHFERIYLQHQLKRAQGSVGQLAKLTGMERTHLYRKLKALGIDPKEVS